MCPTLDKCKHISLVDLENTDFWLICMLPSPCNFKLTWLVVFPRTQLQLSWKQKKNPCGFQITSLQPWNSFDASHLTMDEKLIREGKMFLPNRTWNQQKVLLFSLSISADPIRETDFSQMLMMSYGAVEIASSWKWMDHKWLGNEGTTIN